jgi:pheromone shutdown protein TraB
LIETRGSVTLIGTAHVSPTSVQEVEATIRALKPKRVLVELDASRYAALKDPDAWRNTDIFRVLKEKKHHLFLLQLYLASVQAQMGRATGVAPGAELVKAAQVADETGAQVVLIDRDIRITMKRGFGSMGFWAKARLFWKLWMQLLTPGNDEEAKAAGDRDQVVRQRIESLLETDAITQMTEEFARIAPQVKTSLIDERDVYMASHIVEQAQAQRATEVEEELPGHVVVVVGAGHMKGILAHLDQAEASSKQGTTPATGPVAATPPQARSMAGTIDARDPAAARKPLEAMPPRRFPWATLISLAIPMALAVWLAWQIHQGHTDNVVGVVRLWIVLHILLAGLGAALAGGHILAVLTGAGAAPLTSFFPVGVKSGWLAGLVQAKMRTPKVKDFEAIKHLNTFGDFWRNGIVRVITVTSLTILGSEIATILAGIFVSKGWFV